MRIVTGVFASRDIAAHGLRQLRAVDVHDDRISVLAPGASERQIADVPIAEGEAPGTGAAIGGVVGGAVGLAAGMPLGAAVASLVIQLGFDRGHRWADAQRRRDRAAA